MEKLKIEIIKKFGSLSEFCRKSGISRPSLENYLKYGEKNTLKSKSLGITIDSALKNKDTKYGFIKQSEVEKLEKLIISEFNGNVALFSDVHTFDRTTVYQILSGYRKRKTDIVNQILKVAV